MKSRSIRYALLCIGSSVWALRQPDLQQQVLQSQDSPRVVKHEQRNIIFIMSDDQDLQLDSLSYMPLVDKHLRKEGTFLKNHFVTTALCCPSRVSLWTGKQAHNTNVTDVNPPYGGFPKFIERGFNSDYLPVWLQDAGYSTFYTGKMMNWHTVENYNSPHLAGFTGSDFLLDPYTYSYLNSTYQRNYDAPVSYEGRHTADVLAEKAYSFLEEAMSSDGPFFIAIAPISPHSNIDENIGSARMTAPIPADRHKDLFKNVKVPRTEHFNPNKPSSVNWVKLLPQQTQENVDYNDHFYRSRLRALQSTDEMVDGIITRLEEVDLLDETYIIFTSDNGFHIGQHRLPPGKACGFDEDIRVPFYIRGPGIPKNSVEEAVTTHVDLAPTFFKIAGMELREDFDGTPLPIPYSDGVTPIFRHEHVTVEFWGSAIAEGEYDNFGPSNPGNVVSNNTYKALRLLGDGYNLYYSVWCRNEHELYDLSTDPYQLHNIFPSGNSEAHELKYHNLLGRPLLSVIDRLDSLLMVLKSCKGDICVHPWKVLHPGGEVTNLQESLAETFDAFYAQQVQVSFQRCAAGYLLDAEGPQDYLVYRSGLNWDDWV